MSMNLLSLKSRMKDFIDETHGKLYGKWESELLFDMKCEDQIINKIKKAKTDPLPMPKSLKEIDERVEAKNLIGIYASLTNSTLEKSIENFAGKNFSEFKQKLSEALVDKIEPISTEIKKLLDDKSYLDNTLLEGVERANIIASKKIKRIKEIVGF